MKKSFNFEMYIIMHVNISLTFPPESRPNQVSYRHPFPDPYPHIYRYPKYSPIAH